MQQGMDVGRLPFRGWNRKHGMCKQRLKLVEDWLAPAGRHPAADAADCATNRVVVVASGLVSPPITRPHDTLDGFALAINPL